MTTYLPQPLIYLFIVGCDYRNTPYFNLFSG